MILQPNIPIEEAHSLLVSKIKAYFDGCGMSRAVVGLSGGIDSAVVFALACEALGEGNVHGVLMPSGFSTSHSVKDAEDLARNCGASYDIVPIGRIYDSFMAELEPLFADGQWSVAQENIQARSRAVILMAYSNKRGALVLNTSNKSELFMGYGTLYGDLAGAMMVIADLYKLQVYELARHINRDREIIPVSTMTKAPSAELKPGQKDTDSLPPYEILDPVLHALCEEGRSAEEVIASGADRATVERIIRLKKASAFKVMQIPPMLKVGDHPIAPEFKCL
ncbi:MAG: NAD(+) synthase [Bacteroidales bacterium]|nr:NAD(+) synthase [Bacteroidales bacterium]